MKKKYFVLLITIESMKHEKYFMQDPIFDKLQPVEAESELIMIDNWILSYQMLTQILIVSLLMIVLFINSQIDYLHETPWNKKKVSEQVVMLISST